MRFSIRQLPKIVSLCNVVVAQLGFNDNALVSSTPQLPLHLQIFKPLFD